jgi:putative oxidoreductase
MITYPPDATTISTGLLIGRLIFGLVIAAHGAQKLFGWFGGYGIAGTGGFFESLGFRPGALFATLAGLAEFGGGVLTALGFLGPIGQALMISVMIVAAVTVHWKNGLFATANGVEVPLLNIGGALIIALAGPGLYSLDALLGLDALWTPKLIWVVLLLGIVGGLGNLALRRGAPAAQRA